MMLRKQIYLEPEQNACLKRLSGESGVPEAELIRRATNDHLWVRQCAIPAAILKHGKLSVRSLST